MPIAAEGGTIFPAFGKALREFLFSDVDCLINQITYLYYLAIC